MTPREFAIKVTNELQEAGYQALWAGGCVRDQLVGRMPKDYDVATSATPAQVRAVFGHKKTIAIGAAFGVITVIGPRSAGQIEIATFRRDAGYSDGRRPDSVEFTDAREDAIRRDFTINGMFFDPVKNEVIDYVDGQRDLQRRVIRAIGDPHQRIAEDKLRMLRGVRFAATFDFDLEAVTQAAIKRHASELHAVSPERIGAEMRRILAHSNRVVGVRLLRETDLWSSVLNGASQLWEDEAGWNMRLDSLGRLRQNDFVAAATIVLRPFVEAQGVEPIVHAWKLSNDERKAIAWCLRYADVLSRATELKWSVVQPVLIGPYAELALNVIEAEQGAPSASVQMCRERLLWDRDRLNPVPLVTGDDLIRHGFVPGKRFATALSEVRCAQLDGEVGNQEEALAIAQNLLKAET